MKKIRKFTKGFKFEAVKLVTERALRWRRRPVIWIWPSVFLRRWVREAAEAPVIAFPGYGQQRAKLAKIAALKKEVAKLKAERDLLKNRSEPQPACARITQPVPCCA